MSKAKMETEAAMQTIEQLQARFSNLNTKKITAEANLKNAQQNLDNLKDEAREKFGTDDLNELRKKLRDLKAENEEKRKNYQAELDRIETDLQNVEKNLDAADAAEVDPVGES